MQNLSVFIGKKNDPLRLFRKRDRITLPVGLTTEDTITTDFVPLSKLEDLQQYGEILGMLQGADRETILAIADRNDLQLKFDPLFKAMLPNLSEVGNWGELNAEAKVVVLQRLLESEGG